MFTTHFKMTQQPFQELPPIDGMWVHEDLKQGLAKLNFFIQQKSQVALITGEEGLGKSVFLRLFLQGLEAKQYTPVTLSMTHLSGFTFLRSLVTALGETPAHYKDALLQQIIQKTHQLNVPTLFFIEDAHFLTNESWIDLKQIISTKCPIKLLLLAHPDIKKVFKRSQHIALSQRIAIACSLMAFDSSMTMQYIDFQLRFAGSCDKLFDDEIKQDIHQYSHGCPRLINNLATHCLISGAITKAQKINRTIFQQAIQECPLFV